MKRSVSKLRLSRETLRALDGSRLSRVAGGQTNPSDCAALCTADCAYSLDPSCPTDCFTCGTNCVNGGPPTAGSCAC